MSDRPRLVCWFSAGAASAVATKLALAKYCDTHEIEIARCAVPEEHSDNDRFARDCQEWFGQPILMLRSTEYDSCEDVWTKRKFMSGPHGAPCSIEMKKAVRWIFENAWHPDLQAFGYTIEERKRVDRFRVQNPEVNLINPLIDAGLGKADCHAILDRAGITGPEMYRLGFPNANCIGCVQEQSPRGWNRVRRHFPEVFAARAKMSRELGVKLVKGTSGARERQFLDELDPALDEEDEVPRMDCSLLCYSASQDIGA